MPALIWLMAVCPSCYAAEQGYWTKPGVAQAHANEQYPADSQQCERLALQDEGKDSEKTRATRYTKCMYARGYVWVMEEPGAYPVRLKDSRSSVVPSCDTGRVITDAFGFQKCVPSGGKMWGSAAEVRGILRQDDARAAQRPPSLPQVRQQAGEPQPTKDQRCRRQADKSLANPYSLYMQCMQEKDRP
jgi:hypothetical protein